MYDFQRVGWALNPMLCSTFYILKKTSYTEALNGQTSTISYFYNIPYVCIRIILNLCFVLRGYLCPAYTHVHTSSLSKIIILNLHCSAPFHRHYVYLVYDQTLDFSLSIQNIYIYVLWYSMKPKSITFKFRIRCILPSYFVRSNFHQFLNTEMFLQISLIENSCIDILFYIKRVFIKIE